MSYPLRSLLTIMTLLAVLCGIAMLPWPEGWVQTAGWVGEAWLYFVPGVISIGLCVLGAVHRPRRWPAAVVAIAACGASMALPGWAIWYAREVQGDNTANIGAGILLLAMPVLAPIAAALGWAFGEFVAAWVRIARSAWTRR